MFFSLDLVVIAIIVVYGASLALRLNIFNGNLLHQHAIQSQLNLATVSIESLRTLAYLIGLISILRCWIFHSFYILEFWLLTSYNGFSKLILQFLKIRYTCLEDAVVFKTIWSADEEKTYARIILRIFVASS